MNTKILWLIGIAIIVSFIGGFLLANALNRSELNALRGENERLKNTQTATAQNDSELSLSEGEIRRKIAEADGSPDNIDFQKNLGTALYRYAAMKQDAELLAEVVRLLGRAHEKNPKDSEVTITLGNTYFDIGYFKKDNEQFQKSREFYRKALEQKPDNADVRTDLGLTYFLHNPPENERAIAEFQKSLQTNPAHEKTLQVMAQVLLSENRTDEAEKFLAKLREVNAANRVLPELESQIAQIKNNSQKQ
jgi:tetratricopeptide (TPR) repeat protein